MSKVIFERPIANLTGKISRREKVAFRVRNGRAHTYVIQNPYTGPVAPTRQRTIDAFRSAVVQAGIILKDDAQRAEWQTKYDTYHTNNPDNANKSKKTYHSLRGYIIAQLTAQAKL